MIESLWKLFHQAKSGHIDGSLFDEILKTPNTGFAKLTECLFYINPTSYFPVDAQTKPWLRSSRIEIPKENWQAYRTLLNWLANNTDQPFYQISHEAYLKNKQKESKISMEENNKMLSNPQAPLNCILYGPPGTGKTYATVEMAVQIAEPEQYQKIVEQKMGTLAQRQAIKALYDTLTSNHRIAFSTFHQSFSYEDFIEGIRAETLEEKNNALQYIIEDGVFKKIARLAAEPALEQQGLGLSTSPNIWKISICHIDKKEQREQYIRDGEARIGWPEAGDLSKPLDKRTPDQQNYWTNTLTDRNHAALNDFSQNLQVGDVLLCLRDETTVQAIGIVTSDYKYHVPFDHEEKKYVHVRRVNWILQDISLDIPSINEGKGLTQQTIYQLKRVTWQTLIEALITQKIPLPPALHQSTATHSQPKHVLIVDEINRGNISRIFGELITLLEPDKRKGGSDERSVILPYSKQAFCVPSNLYVIGTMNTADKSLTQLDLALRRRFEFIEIMPNPELLTGLTVHGVNIDRLLQIMNDRIEVLLDRDHLIDHSYFLPLHGLEDSQKTTMLASIFQKRIVPLLQEYFFSDWEKIAWVLNDVDKAPDEQFIQLQQNSDSLQDLFSTKIAQELQDRRYRINLNAFHNAASYQKILPTKEWL